MLIGIGQKNGKDIWTRKVQGCPGRTIWKMVAWYGTNPNKCSTVPNRGDSSFHVPDMKPPCRVREGLAARTARCRGLSVCGIVRKQHLVLIVTAHRLILEFANLRRIANILYFICRSENF